MEILYRAFGLGGGSWRVCLFVKSGSNITYHQWKYENLSDIGGAIQQHKNEVSKLINKNATTSQNLKLISNVEDRYLNCLIDKIEDNLNKNIDVRSNYNPPRNDDSVDIWVLSRYLCDRGIYDFSPYKKPEPPYTIYTDASYWPDIERASIGFVIRGSNRGVYTFGSPIGRDIPDNNIAEFYSALSALKRIPCSDKVQIITDSENLKHIHNMDLEDPRNDVIPNLVDQISICNLSQIESVDRKDVEISDEIARMCKNKPIEFGAPPKRSF